MDQIQKERRELIQEAANLEIILQTYLGRKGTELEELFQNLTKAELVQMEEASYIPSLPTSGTGESMLLSACRRSRLRQLPVTSCHRLN